MFVDELKIHAKAGKGGNGVERWLNEKGKEFGGPSGGNGGKGGDIYVVAVKDLGLLAHYRNVKEFTAPSGADGERNSRFGKGGDDLEIKLPIGSVITNLTTKRKISLLTEGQKELILSGGIGGLGNEYFKSSTNRNPTQTTPGREGEEADFYIELELVADAGFVGLPNAGKSSILNALTNAKAKVGAFAFTTLEPNLGDFHGYILADIPGLIEGASLGKGLGDKFLRHIKRTKKLFHCISPENEDILAAYDTIRNELKSYDESLLEKSEVVIITKTDLINETELQNIKDLLSSRNKNILSVTILDDDQVKALSTQISRELAD